MRRSTFLFTAILLGFGPPFHVGAQAAPQALPFPKVPDKSLPTTTAAPLATATSFSVVPAKQPEVPGDLATADGLGIRPVPITGPASLEGIAPNGQPFKWVLSTDGRLWALTMLDRHVARSDKDRDIIKHVVATRGRPVLPAGIGQLQGSTLLIDNRSGHYRPSPESLSVAVPVFKADGFATVEVRQQILPDH